MGRFSLSSGRETSARILTSPTVLKVWVDFTSGFSSAFRPAVPLKSMKATNAVRPRINDYLGPSNEFVAASSTDQKSLLLPLISNGYHRNRRVKIEVIWRIAEEQADNRSAAATRTNAAPLLSLHGP